MEAKQGCRLILPSKDIDHKPEDSDDTNTQVNIGLVDSKFSADIKLCVKPSYYRLRAVVEAKRDKAKGDLRDAFAQLCEYTRQMYTVQHNLCSAFGFTICPGDVRMFHFGHGKIVSSNLMDVASPKDRHAFIELLVNLSLCDDSQLSCDLPMKYLPDFNCWQTVCPHNDNGASHSKVAQYYFTNVICITNISCSHHTTNIRPTKRVKEGESI
ncbi:hypothetical protein GGI17_005529 [Coemansia sp. S146]|nr:hypothetical protein GGI17_005529 [Coemansia sp. S146]